MYKAILTPLDYSGFAETALGVAISVARNAGARLYLTMADLAPVLLPTEYDADVVNQAARQYLEGVADRIQGADGVEVDIEVVSGDVAKAVEDLRVRVGAGLTVMATHGRGPASRAWLGSTADTYLRHTEGPLLLVRPEDEEEEVDLAGRFQVQRILVATDGSTASEAILDPVVELGRVFGAALHLVRIVEFPHGIPSVYLPDAVLSAREQLDGAREAAEQETRDLVDRLQDRGVAATSSVEVAGHAAPGILSAAKDGSFDLIAIATHGRGGVRRMVLGSVADKVIRGAEVPVLVVRPKD